METTPFPHSKIKRVVYHASWKDKTAGFSRTRETGIYFSDTPRTKAFGKYATAAYINILNPFLGDYDEIAHDWIFPGVTEDYEEWAVDNHIEDLANPTFEEYIEYLEDRGPNPYEDLSVVRAIKEAGFDGIVGNDTHGGTREYIVFDPSQVVVISSQVHESVVSSPNEYKQGECFRNALKWASKQWSHGNDNLYVVHGKATGGHGTINHAWVEDDKEGTVIDPTTGATLPKERFYSLLSAQPEAKYTPEQANINMIRSGKVGPWFPEEVGNRIVWRKGK